MRTRSEVLERSLSGRAEGTFEERLRRDAHRLKDDINARHVATLMAIIFERAMWDPSTKALRDRLYTEVLDNIEAAVNEAVAAGELLSTPDPEDLATEVLGGMFFRRLASDDHLTAEIVDRLVDRALRDHLPA